MPNAAKFALRKKRKIATGKAYRKKKLENEKTMGICLVKTFLRPLGPLDEKPI